jgi:hypothetical protein
MDDDGQGRDAGGETIRATSHQKPIAVKETCETRTIGGVNCFV